MHSTRTKIPKVILKSKTGFKRLFKRFLVYKNNSESKIYSFFHFVFIVNNDKNNKNKIEYISDRFNEFK